MTSTTARNVLGTALVPCSDAPLIGDYRDGGCKLEVFDASAVPPVVLACTHAKALQFVTSEQWQTCA